MLDAYLRPIIDPPLNYFGARCAGAGISANHMTFAGFLCGLMGMYLILIRQYEWAAIAIILNRFADGLDGAIARNSELSDFGGFLDITADFIIYSGVIFAFGMSDETRLPYALFLIFSFIGPITSFLAYAIIASKRGLNTQKRGRKSFYYLGGICEGTETAFMLLLCCVLPQYFNEIALVYGVLCWVTTFGRVYCAACDFGSTEPSATSDIYTSLEAAPTLQDQTKQTES